MVRIASGWALALIFISCGGGSGNGELAFEDLEDADLSAVCRYEASCGGVPDQASCTGALLTTKSLFPTLRADIAAGTVVYDARAARRCIDLLAGTTSCKLTEVADLNGRLAETCGAVFSGTLAPGSECFFDEECADHGRCDRPGCTSPGGCCAGACVAAPVPIPAGDACSSGSTDVCAAGTECQSDQLTDTETCRTPLARGAACALTDSCADRYYCVTPTPAGGTGSCTAPPGRGQPCGTQTTAPYCDDVRDTCELATQHCTPLTPVGGACDASAGPPCVGYATCIGSTCVALGRVGDSCDVQTGAAPYCLGDLECDVNLRCIRPAAGGSCR
jgi:hypothetical protein